MSFALDGGLLKKKPLIGWVMIIGIKEIFP